MMLVQNHQQPLSGSNLCLLIALVILVLPSCAIFGPGTNKKDASPGDQSSDLDREDKIKVDTIEWVLIPDEAVNPIESRNARPKTVYKDSYNVAFIAPFSSANFQVTSDRLNARMIRMIEFYAGLKYGWQHHNQDLTVHLSAIDSQTDNEFAEDITDHPALQEADLIIGPYFTDELRTISNFARSKKKILLSPWNTTEVISENPYYVQLRPSLKAHAEAIVQHIVNKPYGDVILLCKDDPRDSLTVTYFENAWAKHVLSGGDSGNLIPMKIGDITDPALGDTLTAKIVDQNISTFIIPNWSDEPFVISALAKINFSKADKQVTVFGLPQWMQMTKMDYSYYENLNVHISLARPLKFDNTELRALKQFYFNKYGDVANEDVYYGMEVMRLICTLLKENGTMVTDNLELPMDRFSYKFDFISVFSEDGEQIDHYENRQVQIAKFEDYRFVPAD